MYNVQAITALTPTKVEFSKAKIEYVQCSSNITALTYTKVEFSKAKIKYVRCSSNYCINL